MSAMRSTPSVLIIGYVWPELSSSAAGLRDWNLVDLFLSRGWKLTYTSSARENEHSEALKKRGVDARCLAPNDPAFDIFIAELRPDFVIFDRFVVEEQFGWRVHDHSPDSIRIVDTQDLHSLRRARERALKEGLSFERIYAADPDLLTSLAGDDLLRELASIYRSDSTLVISDFEERLLMEQLRIPPELIQLFRFCYPEPDATNLPDFSERRHFALLGNFRHPPNMDGVRWLKREIWPRIRRRLPDAEVHVYGAYPSREAMEMDDARSGFRVLGPAASPAEVFRKCRVNLAPLRFGAGIKGKIADGWLSGAPVVSTPIGSEGMDNGSPEHWGGCIARNEDEIAGAAVRLHENAEDWARARNRGLELARILFDSKANGDALIRHLLDLAETVKERRRANLVGQMLWYHGHRSTTYFSKWIELKEKLQ